MGEYFDERTERSAEGELISVTISSGIKKFSELNRHDTTPEDMSHYMGLDPKNIDLICALHKDKPHHLHIHFWFAEKEPKCKYRKKQTEYRHKGKIEKSVIDKMHVRLNLCITEPQDKLYMSRDEALRALKKISALRDIITKDDVK